MHISANLFCLHPDIFDPFWLTQPTYKLKNKSVWKLLFNELICNQSSYLEKN